MSSPQPGAALLVAGYGWQGEPDRADSVVHTLGEIGEALLATPAPWRIRRLSPSSGERSLPDRSTLKLQVTELVRESVAVVILAVAGTITTDFGEPALVAGPHYRDFPEDALLPLSWIRGQLGGCRAERVLVVLAARGNHGPGDTKAWLEALATHRPLHLIAVHSSGDDAPGIGALLSGLCGDALDPKTGTVTLRSMGEHLARRLPGLAVQPSESIETLAPLPPLGGLWDFRLSRTMQASRRDSADPPKPGAPEELIGVILPGRFRVERVLAEGSFGIVYRARQLTVERDVAIKVLQAGIDPTSKNGRLFVYEIQSVGRLDHPNVVRIHQADIAPDGRLFFAMELLIGLDLQQIINAERTLETKRAVALLRQLLDGLGAAHDAGLVHADVKPANAFVVTTRDQERLVLVDFGMARLRPPGIAAESAGGTPAYMAPEQLNEGRVDSRSDLFSAALVLVTLLTGWRRKSAEELVPPLATIDDGHLRKVLARALALDPADRFQTAAHFADALAGNSPSHIKAVPTRPPFRHLAPLTEDDRGRLHGRDREIAALAEQVLYRRAVIYAAPSGTGKTSLLRAGLLPRMEALGARAVFLSCRADANDAVPPAIWPGATSVAEAVAAWHAASPGKKLVLIFDQIELALPDEPNFPEGEVSTNNFIHDVLAFRHWPSNADVAVVLSVREDYLARLMAWSQPLEPAIPVMRLGPLGPGGAREAIVAPLGEARLTITTELLDVLLADLQTAAVAIGPEMGWGTVPAIYPPHLQLACSVLYEALAPGEAELTLSHYRRLGGLDAIVGEYLERVLETELDAGSAGVARDLFLALVTSAHTRAMRTEAELIEIVGGRHGADRINSVLQVLHARGLVVRLSTTGGEPGWELIHDSLVPRVLGWIDRHDLARRRAVELVRYHLRRSRPDAPSLLTRAELRELRPYPDAVAELDAEWARRRGGAEAWTPSRIVDRSRRKVLREILVVVCASIAALSAVGFATYRWAIERDMRGRNMGRFAFELRAFDWDAEHLQPIDVQMISMPNLRWQLYEPDENDRDSPGKPLGDQSIVRGMLALTPDRNVRLEQVEARGGKTFLVLEGRGRGGEECAPSIIPLRQLPGYFEREREERIALRIPTCQASRAGTVEIQSGLYWRGGLGTPPATPVTPEDVVPEQIAYLPAFAIDRTEVTNAAFRVLAGMQSVTGISMPSYPKALQGADGDRWPVAGVTWTQARAYCRFIGKELPTSDEWQKTARGGLRLSDGRTNDYPRRNLPWGEPHGALSVNLSGVLNSAAPVGSSKDDVSPYHVVDLAGNVQEWTDTVVSEGTRITRGGNWDETKTDNLLYYMAFENERAMNKQSFTLGMRCAARAGQLIQP